MRIGIIVNPVHARTHRAHHRLVGLLTALDIRYRTTSTTPEAPGSRQAQDLVDWGAEAVVLLGGDGTLRSAAPVLATAGVPVLVVPTGTANVFSRGFGLHTARSGLALCEDFLHGAVSQAGVPISAAEFLDASGAVRHEHFLSLAGIGGDARAVAAHDRAWGLLGYARGALLALFAPQLTARIDGEELEVWSVMAAKTRRPAGPVPVFPGAEAVSEDLEFLAVVLGPGAAARRLGEWVGIGAACLRGHPERDPAMRYWTARRSTITVSEPAPIELDGDHLGEAVAVEIDTGELMLDVIVPAESRSHRR